MSEPRGVIAETNVIRAVLWTGGDAPYRQSELKVSPQYMGFAAYYEPGYCGCPDCHWIVGHGATEAEAVNDYWEQWEYKYGD